MRTVPGSFGTVSVTVPREPAVRDCRRSRVPGPSPAESDFGHVMQPELARTDRMAVNASSSGCCRLRSTRRLHRGEAPGLRAAHGCTGGRGMGRRLLRHSNVARIIGGPCMATEKLRRIHWRTTFHEYFHGDNGAGPGQPSDPWTATARPCTVCHNDSEDCAWRR